MNLQLARNIPSVGDYSMNRNIEFFGYFLIGHPPYYATDNFFFSLLEVILTGSFCKIHKYRDFLLQRFNIIKQINAFFVSLQLIGIYKSAD